MQGHQTSGRTAFAASVYEHRFIKTYIYTEWHNSNALSYHHLRYSG
jgi:hypothetical protein